MTEKLTNLIEDFAADHNVESIYVHSKSWRKLAVYLHEIESVYLRVTKGLPEPTKEEQDYKVRM